MNPVWRKMVSLYICIFCDTGYLFIARYLTRLLLGRGACYNTNRFYNRGLLLMLHLVPMYRVWFPLVSLSTKISTKPIWCHHDVIYVKTVKKNEEKLVVNPGKIHFHRVCGESFLKQRNKTKRQKKASTKQRKKEKKNFLAYTVFLRLPYHQWGLRVLFFAFCFVFCFVIVFVFVCFFSRFYERKGWEDNALCYKGERLKLAEKPFGVAIIPNR